MGEKQDFLDRVDESIIKNYFKDRFGVRYLNQSEYSENLKTSFKMLNCVNLLAMKTIINVKLDSLCPD